jgi:hypothetical protein
MDRKKRPTTWSAGAILLLAMGIGMLAIGIVLTVREYMLGLNGVPAVGTVMQYEKFGRSIRWTITYQNQGQTVSAKVEPTAFSGLELNKQVAILYDPNDPKTINVNNFWHRYFYPALFFGFAGLFLGLMLTFLWPSDENWLQTYSMKLLLAAGEAPPVRRADQFVLAVWNLNLAAGSRPRAAIASYFEINGEAKWESLKELWDRDKVPNLAPVVDEIERIIAGNDPVTALTAASPDIEKFYFSHRPAILRELRDYAMGEDSETSARE